MYLTQGLSFWLVSLAVSNNHFGQPPGGRFTVSEWSMACIQLAHLTTGIGAEFCLR
jgi:hypothetical protein